MTVWLALNDPAVLRASIPGCESMEKTGDGEFAAGIAAVLGPVRARFRGKLRLEDVEAPRSYTLRFEGDGGVAGHARGIARVTLTEDAGATILDYAVESQVGGRIAQVGNRLVGAAALKLADDFFAAFEKNVAGERPSPKGEGELLPSPRGERDFPVSTKVMVAIAAIAVLLALVFFAIMASR